jgi:hypothetical protein
LRKKKIIEPEKNEPKVTKQVEKIEQTTIAPMSSVRKNINIELYSDIEKKLVEYFNAQPTSE